MFYVCSRKIVFVCNLLEAGLLEHFCPPGISIETLFVNFDQEKWKTR